MGAAFENIFDDYVSTNPIASSFQIGRNNKRFSGGDRNTVPDFIGDLLYVIRETGLTARMKNASWYELKAKDGGLYMSSNQWQMMGHIDNLARIFSLQMAEYSGFSPSLYLITTADTNFSPGIAAYAASKNITYVQYHAEYKNVNGNWQFRFN